jgi:hypothetical protein
MIYRRILKDGNIISELIHIFLKLVERPTIMNSDSTFRYTDQEIIEQLRQSGKDKREAKNNYSTGLLIIREGITKHGLSEDESFNAYSDTLLALFKTSKTPILRPGVPETYLTRFSIINVLTYPKKDD